MKKDIADGLTHDLNSHFFKDVYLSSRAISWSCGISFFWCILFLYLMSYFAECISWVIVGLVQIGLFAASGFSMFQYNNLKSQKDTVTDDQSDTMKTLLVIGIISGVLGLLFMCAVCCFFTSLKIAIDVIDASADFLAKTKRIILVPVIFFVFNVIAVLVWLTAYISVTTLKFDKVVASGEVDDGKLHQIKTAIVSTNPV